MSLPSRQVIRLAFKRGFRQRCRSSSLGNAHSTYEPKRLWYICSCGRYSADSSLREQYRLFLRRVHRILYSSCRVLYGQQSVDSLVNSRITHLLERFLYMRPERICNAYMSYVRQKNEDVFVVSLSFLDAPIRRLSSLFTLCRKQIRHQHSLLTPFHDYQP